MEAANRWTSIVVPTASLNVNDGSDPQKGIHWFGFYKDDPCIIYHTELLIHCFSRKTV